MPHDTTKRQFRRSALLVLLVGILFTGVDAATTPDAPHQRDMAAMDAADSPMGDGHGGHQPADGVSAPDDEPAAPPRQHDTMAMDALHPPPAGEHDRHMLTDDAAMLDRDIGVSERLGALIPLTARFQDEKGRNVTLGEMIQKPTIILPVYYSCPSACNMMLGNLASAFKDVPLAAGNDYQAIALSFDTDDNPERAREAKANYLPIVGPNFPGDQWKFLTGDQTQISTVLDAIGYRAKKTGPGMFVHPNVLVVVSPDGKIIRYLYGVNFLAFDIGMALTEAQKGTPQLSVRRMLTYCFDYDPGQKRYVFKAFRVVAVAILLAMAVFFFFLLRKGNRDAG